MAQNVSGARPLRTSPERRAYVYLGGLLLVALALLAWLLIRGGGENVTVPPAGKGPAVVSEAQLRLLARSIPHPVYWAGSARGVYELTRTKDGRIYIRYLPSGDNVGDRAPNYLTIGTYPTKTAFLGLKRAARRNGAVSLKLDRGGLLLLNSATPKSVYFAYPKSSYQVEVYDPSAQDARRLVLAGEIKPIK